MLLPLQDKPKQVVLPKNIEPIFTTIFELELTKDLQHSEACYFIVAKSFTHNEYQSL